jgi:superoxide reductase
MVKTNELYKCSVCGNIVEVVRVGGGELVCCGKPMNLLEAGVTEASTEKHIPVIERIDGGYLVKVGSVAHPMLPEHYIEFIEIMTSDGKIGRKYLKPGDAPEAKFNNCKGEIVYAREYCNIHGLWATK